MPLISTFGLDGGRCRTVLMAGAGWLWIGHELVVCKGSIPAQLCVCRACSQRERLFRTNNAITTTCEKSTSASSHLARTAEGKEDVGERRRRRRRRKRKGNGDGEMNKKERHIIIKRYENREIWYELYGQYERYDTASLVRRSLFIQVLNSA